MLFASDQNDDGPGNDAGAVYILFGKIVTSQTYRLDGDGVDVTILGKVDSDKLGTSLASAGDINADGFDDIIAGAPNNDDIASNSGAAYVIFGRPSFSATIQMDGEAGDVTLLGKALDDSFGQIVGGAGDLNGDGFDDLVVGTPQNDDPLLPSDARNSGAAYILYGAASLSATYQMNGAGVSVTILGKGANDYLGLNVIGMGDTNEDGFDDAVIGARVNDDAAADAGAAYFIFGRFFPSNITLDLADSAENVKVTGKAAADELGFFSGGAGDVNDDGFFDIILGGRLNDDGPGANNDGATYIIYGGVSLPSSIPAGNSDVTLTGKAAGDRLGASVSGIGDVNYDGFPDMLMGAFQNADISIQAGAAYILFGSETLSSAFRLDGAGADVTVLGKTGYDRLGLVISGGRGNPGP